MENCIVKISFFDTAAEINETCIFIDRFFRHGNMYVRLVLLLIARSHKYK